MRYWSSRTATALAAVLMIAGCSESPHPVLPSHPSRPERTTVVFLGDSLTAGYGVDAASSFPAVIQAFWTAKGLPWKAINEGVSGDTTADVLARLDGSRAPGAELTLLEIGANDAFQGVPTETTAGNMKRIIERVRKGGSRVALCAMYFGEGFLPSGDAYTREFNDLYVRVGKAENVPVLPPLLRSLFSNSALWQADGVHPTAEGHGLIARDLLADLNPEWKQ